MASSGSAPPGDSPSFVPVACKSPARLLYLYTMRSSEWPEDFQGWLWIATSAHILRVNRDRLLNGSAGEGDVQEYGLQDGLPATEGVNRDRSVLTDSHGRIWFSMSRGISVVDPARLVRSSVPALVHIQTISADGSQVDLHRTVQIPSNAQRIIFNFTGLSLSAPDRVQYRYMLDGFDRAWSAPTSITEAGYSNLHPGPYRFRVIASNAAGLWNGVEASTALEIEPMYWQTWWFSVSAALSGVLAIAGLYRYRMRQLTRQLSLRFEDRLAERTRIAQELHDTLLQGFLSASMQLHVTLDGLPADSPVKPPLGSVLELMKHVVDEGRNTVQGLRSSYSSPPDLAEAFSGITRELAIPAEVGFRIVVEGQSKPLPPILRDEIYRIGREALINAFRHAHATSIELELEYTSRGLRVFVRDNGCGIDPRAVGSGRERNWGLPGMRERAESIGARLRVWSRAAAGTEIELSVPGHLAFRLASTRGTRQWFGRHAKWPWALDGCRVPKRKSGRGSERNR